MLRFPMTLWPSDSPETPLTAVMVYDKSDALAVRLAFVKGSRETVAYTFGRDLLAEGLDQRAGDAAVVVQPHPEFPEVWLQVTLLPEHGYPFELYVARAQVESVVAAIYQLVPMGRELIDVDAAIGRILAEVS